LLYAYATKQRSASGVERHCRQDVAYRVITANRVPDHATIARFVVRHEAALGEPFGSVLELCAKAGLVSTGVVAIDGTELAANANREANLDYERIAREIVAEAKATDEAEDHLYGGARGDELPAELRTRAGRRRWLAEAKRELDTEPSEIPAEPRRRGGCSRAIRSGAHTNSDPRSPVRASGCGPICSARSGPTRSGRPGAGAPSGGAVLRNRPAARMRGAAGVGWIPCGRRAPGPPGRSTPCRIGHPHGALRSTVRKSRSATGPPPEKDRNPR
jgi:hypothetical protein